MVIDFTTALLHTYSLASCLRNCCIHHRYSTAQFNLTFTHVWHVNFWTNFSCHSWVTCEQIIKIYIYTHVTLDSLNKFIGLLMSCTRGLNKFVGLFASCTQALNKSVEPLASYTWAHDLMHLWSVLLARNVLCYV